MLWLAAVDTARAQKAPKAYPDCKWKDSAFENIANKQIKAGEVADASQTAVAFRAKDQRNRYRKLSLMAAATTRPTSKAVVKASIGLINWE